MNEKLIMEALRILEDRSDYWESQAPIFWADDIKDVDAAARASAYGNAAIILRYAIEGKADCVAQFSYK